MGSLTHYAFKSVWTIEARFDDVCSVLADVRTYPAWWPEIRAVRELDQSHFEVVARALLPYELRFVSEGRIENWRRGVIDARLSGDLQGFARWSVESVGASCRLVYDQEVDTNKALLKILGPVARPAFRMNHSLMMRNGQAGLRTFMDGYARRAAGREHPGGERRT